MREKEKSENFVERVVGENLLCDKVPGINIQLADISDFDILRT